MAVRQSADSEIGFEFLGEVRVLNYDVHYFTSAADGWPVLLR